MKVGNGVRFALFTMLAAAAGFLLFGCGPDDGRGPSPSGNDANQGRNTATDDGEPRPTGLTLEQLGAEEAVSLDEVIGRKGVVLEFFTTWCGICMESVPKIKAFYRNHGDEVAFYAVSLDNKKSTVEEWMARDDIDYPVLFDADQAAARHYGITGVPTIIGINAEGDSVVRQHHLPSDAQSFINRLRGDGQATDAATE